MMASGSAQAAARASSQHHLTEWLQRGTKCAESNLVRLEESCVKLDEKNLSCVVDQLKETCRTIKAGLEASEDASGAAGPSHSSSSSRLSSMLCMLRSLVSQIPKRLRSDELRRWLAEVEDEEFVSQQASGEGQIPIGEKSESIDISVSAAAWLSMLRPRSLNLVTEGGATEFFVIDGDALILENICDPSLDWSSQGCQFLHLAFLVERTLSELRQRDCNFSVVFFRKHACLWRADEEMESTNASKTAAIGARVAREALILHLTCMHRVSPSLCPPVYHFESWLEDDPLWTEFLLKEKPAFVLTSDGETSDTGALRPNTKLLAAARFVESEASGAPVTQRGLTLLKLFAIDLLHRNQTVVFLSGLRYSSSNIFGFAVSHIPTGLCTKDQAARLARSIQDYPRLGNAGHRTTLIANRTKIVDFARRSQSLAHAVFCYTVALALSEMPREQREDITGFANLLVLHSTCLQFLALEHRSFSSAPALPSPEMAAFVQSVLDKMAVTTSLLDELSLSQEDNVRVDLVDAYDGRLLANCCIPGALKLTLQQLALAQRAWAFVADIAEVSRDFVYPTTQGGSVENAEASSAQQDFEPLLLVNSTLVNRSEAIGRVPEVPGSESLSRQRSLIENGNGTFGSASLVRKHRWRPDDQIENDIERLYFSKEAAMSSSQSQKYFAYMHKYGDSLGSSRSLHHRLTVNRTTALQLADRFRSERDQESDDEQHAEPVAPSQETRKKTAHAHAVASSKKPKPLSSADRIRLENEARLKREETEREMVKARGQLSSLRSDARADLDAALTLFGEKWKESSEPEASLLLGMEVVELSMRLWDDTRLIKDAVRAFRSAVDVFDKHRCVLQKSPTNPSPRQELLRILEVLQLLGLTRQAELAFREALFTEAGDRFPALRTSTGAHSRFSVKVPGNRFQLQHAHSLMERDMLDAKPDARVKFNPDKWQRDLLDIVDRRESALVVAPTSSGKTFISYYAMEKVLRESDDGVVVYVAPSKALVNQVAAEVNVRFGEKNYSSQGRQVFGVLTQKYQINSLTCQVLVTVPQLLEQLLLSPNATVQEWLRRIRYVIFDEIHCIAEEEGGRVWQNVLQMTRAPFVALSATVGNPVQLTRYMECARRYRKRSRVHLVSYEHRFADLLKHTYLPNSFQGTGLEGYDFSVSSQSRAIGSASSSGSSPFSSILPVHPYSLLSLALARERGIPVDLSFTSEETLQLYDLMVESSALASTPEDASSGNLASLDPEVFFANKYVLKKSDARLYENAVKREFESWIRADVSSAAYRRAAWVLEKLSSPVTEGFSQCEASWSAVGVNPYGRAFVLRNFTNLLRDLSSRNMLPALVFTLDRYLAMDLVEAVLDTFEREQARRLAAAPEIERQRRAREKEARVEKRRREREAKRLKEAALEELVRDGLNVVEADDKDDDDIDPQLSFVTEHAKGRCPYEDWEWKKISLAMASQPSHLYRALKRGIGCHHPGLPRAYREAVEVLFRCGYLRVVVSTETLALGINMPCRTVVFAGDTQQLNPLLFRQMSGRAGRRGFDPLGHVVMFGLTSTKISRLWTSTLPKLAGHFPVNTTLVLRVLHLVSQTRAQNDNNNEHRSVCFVQDIARSVQRQAFFYNGHAQTQDQLSFHLRYILEMLRRCYSIDDQANLCGFTPVALLPRLIDKDAQNFVLLELLNSGALHSACSNDLSDATGSMESIAKTFAFVFSKELLPRFVKPRRTASSELSSQFSFHASRDLPRSVVEQLQSHNRRVMTVALEYVRAFARLCADKLPRDNELPLSKLTFPVTCLEGRAINSNPVFYIARSSFAALSGKGDEDFVDADDFIRTLRPGIVLDKTSLPFADLTPRGCMRNAFLYDFYTHGQVRPMYDENGIRSGDAWELLNDFALTMLDLAKTFAACSSASDNVTRTVNKVAEEFDRRFLRVFDR